MFSTDVEIGHVLSGNQIATRGQFHYFEQRSLRFVLNVLARYTAIPSRLGERGSRFVQTRVNSRESLQ